MRRVFNWARVRDWVQFPLPDPIMNTWLSLVAVLGAALLAAASPVTDGDACKIEYPNLPGSSGIRLVLRELVEPCFKEAMTEETVAHIRDNMSLEDFRNFYKAYCTHVPQVTTCMAGVRERLSHCQNKDISMLFTIMIELSDHLLPAGCDNEGERLAYITQAVYLILNQPDTLIPLGRCVFEVMEVNRIVRGANFSLASETYNFYKDTTKLKKCTKHMDDEAVKSAVEWMMDEIHATMKCKHPEEKRLIPCSEVDVSKLSVIDVCKREPFDQGNLYDVLEWMTITDCCGRRLFSHDKVEGSSNHTDLAWLKEEYKTKCHAQRTLPECIIVMSAYGKMCLSQEEDKQFQLEIQALEDSIMRICAEDGAQLAEIMHHVYAMVPEHGHAIRDCYKHAFETSAAYEGHAVSTKNMRFYDDSTIYWQCLVGKMRDNSDIVQIVEAMMNDVLKKIKCVNPEDGLAVACESIHEHH